MGLLAHFRFLVALSLASITSGTTRALKPRQVIEPPDNWVNLGGAPRSSHIFPLRIVLLLTRFSELEQHLSEVSDPFHPSYGKRLPKEDVKALAALPVSSGDAVLEWLESHGVQKEACHMSPAGDWEFRMWKHVEDVDDLAYRTYTADDDIESCQGTTYHFIDLDSNTASSQSSSAKITVPLSGVTVDVSCNKLITVSCFKQLYNAVDYVPRAADKNAIGLIGAIC
ncbi:hypothetical protein H4582DRAFT_2105453 [Lactarius indigo]|nr:hypothetical protein H4582DRAFT_2105453 [Lactarius indigo]